MNVQSKSTTVHHTTHHITHHTTHLDHGLLVEVQVFEDEGEEDPHDITDDERAEEDHEEVRHRDQTCV